jgi:hypothetical protein
MSFAGSAGSDNNMANTNANPFYSGISVFVRQVILLEGDLQILEIEPLHLAMALPFFFFFFSVAQQHLKLNISGLMVRYHLFLPDSAISQWLTCS